MNVVLKYSSKCSKNINILNALFKNSCNFALDIV